jgi:hypothetical protein
MPETLQVPELVLASAPAAPRQLVAAIALVSFASLLLELSLTRLFSVVLFYHFAFLAISVALLGLGAGGVMAYLNRERLLRWTTPQLGLGLGLANSIMVVVALEVVLHAQVSLLLNSKNFWNLTATYLAAGVPFFFTGLLFAAVFAREERRIGLLYGADLLGGALACLVTVPVLNFMGAPNAVFLAACAMAISAALWAGLPEATMPRMWKFGRPAAIAIAALLLVAIGVNHNGKLADIIYAKGRRRNESWMLYAKWNAISRVEVNQIGEAKYIVIDADASTAIMNSDPKEWNTQAWREEMMGAPPAMANVLRPHGDFAIIGPGGGVDVLRAAGNGSPNVTCIEINPIIATTIMRGLYADYAYHLYEQPQVHMNVSDGRSFLRASHDRYDVVQMTLVDTWASTAAGAFALSENNLYTVEAFREYFDHLKPDGFIAITRWEFKEPREALRVVSQALAALPSGPSEYVTNFIVISDGPLDSDGRPVTVLAKKTPFTDAETDVVLANVAKNENLHVIYAAGRSAEQVRAKGARMATSEAVWPFEQLISSAGVPGIYRQYGSSMSHFVATYSYDITPATDNAPFFFFTLKTRNVVRDLLNHTGHGMDWNVNLGVVVLGMLLVMSVVAVLLFLIFPLVLLQSRQAFQTHDAREPSPSLAGLPAVVVLTGFAVITGMQRFVLFLGHPAYAWAATALVMVLAGATGNIAASWWVRAKGRAIGVLAAAALCVAAYGFLLRTLLASLVELPPWAKLIGAILLLLFLISPAAQRAARLRSHRSGNLRAASAGKTGRVGPLLYFIAIGLGYILVEVTFIQRFVLFLGHPTYALTVVVFLMLLSSGAGSIAARHWMARTNRLRVALAAIVLTALVYIFVLPLLLTALVGLPFLLKLLISAALLAPLGFAMGMPFPTGLRAVGAQTREPVLLAGGDAAVGFGQDPVAQDSLIEWAWAMNAAASVLGSVLAIVIAIHFGLNITLATGAVAYAAATLLAPELRAEIL